MIPAEDYVDVEMTIRNQTEFLWHDVFAFNCLNPTGAPDFKDWTLERTYMSSQGKPLCLARTQRVHGHMPTVGFYLPDRVEAGKESVFVRGFGATSPDRTDGSWIATLSQPEASYMAAAVVDAAFLFDNLDRCCIHTAPGFGDIGPGQAGTTVSRFYFAKGPLEDFLNRYAADRPGLAFRPATEDARRSTPPSATERAARPGDKQVELAKFDDPANHLPAQGPGGTEWDSHYRAFIQSQENALSKGFPSHGEASGQIKADAVHDPASLRKHKGWILFIKHHSQAYRPQEATDALRKLYQDLVKSTEPAPVLIEIHGGGWR